MIYLAIRLGNQKAIAKSLVIPEGEGCKVLLLPGLRKGRCTATGPLGVPLAGVRVGMREGACHDLWKHQ